MPDTTSLTKDCAPKPIAMPKTLAPARIGAMLTPIDDSIDIATISNNVTINTTRKSGSSVAIRASGPGAEPSVGGR